MPASRRRESQYQLEVLGDDETDAEAEEVLHAHDAAPDGEEGDAEAPDVHEGLAAA